MLNDSQKAIGKGKGMDFDDEDQGPRRSKWLKNACNETLKALAAPDDWEQGPERTTKGSGRGPSGTANYGKHTAARARHTAGDAMIQFVRKSGTAQGEAGKKIGKKKWYRIMKKP